MTDCLKIVDFLNYPSKVKIKIRKLAAHDLRHILKLCRLDIPCQQTHIDNLFKKKYVSLFVLQQPKILYLRNVQNFIDVPQGFLIL